MTVVEFLDEIQRLDICLSAAGPDRLVVDAPWGALTPNLKARLAARKPEILAFLAQAGTSSQLTSTRRGYLVPADLPERWREMYEERAAVREFDGGQTREHAEAEALTEVRLAMRAAEGGRKTEHGKDGRK